MTFERPLNVLCAKCGNREGTELIGDSLATSHGFCPWWCRACLLEVQIAHCEERAAALPGLQAELASLRAAGEGDT